LDGWVVDQPDLASRYVKSPAGLTAVEYDARDPSAWMPKPHIGDPGLEVIVMAGEPFRICDVAELDLQRYTAAAGQGDCDIAAPPSVSGPGLHPGGGAMGFCPSPQLLFACGVPQGFRIVPAVWRCHPGRVSEMSAARTTLAAFRDQRDHARAAGQVRTFVALPADQCPVPVVALVVPLPGFPVTGMHFPPGYQIQADHEQIHYDTSDDEPTTAGDQRSPAPLARELAG
jgi:hypothetical protein